LLLVVLGFGCLFLAGFAAVIALTGPPGAPAPGDLGVALSGIVFYVILAVCCFALGSGSLRLRRWSRPLVLILSWLWLASGVVSLAVVSLFLPRMMESSRPPGADAEVMSFAMGCTFVFLAVLYVILPGILITFYSNRDVAATLAARDPVPRWTDRCPPPVLGLSVVLAYAALCWLVVPLLPVGALLGGGSTLAVIGVVAAALLAALAWGALRLRPWAWWGVLALWLLWTSAAAAVLRNGVDLKRLYQQMSIPEAQIAEMEKTGILRSLQGPELRLALGAVAFAGLLYLFWVRKHFRPSVPGAPGELP